MMHLHLVGESNAIGVELFAEHDYRKMTFLVMAMLSLGNERSIPKHCCCIILMRGRQVKLHRGRLSNVLAYILLNRPKMVQINTSSY